MVEEKINENNEIFAPTADDFAKELMRKLGYDGTPEKGLNQIYQEVKGKLNCNNPETPEDVVSLYIPSSKKARVVGQVIFLNKMENPGSPLKVGLYFRRSDLFEGRLCQANTTAGINFFKHFAIDLLENGGEIETSNSIDDLLLNFPE